MAKWNEKWTMLWGFYLWQLILPGLFVICAMLFPFMYNHPILFWSAFIIMAIAGFIVVWKRTGRKDKRE